MTLDLQERPHVPLPTAEAAETPYIPASNRKGMLSLWTMRHLVMLMVRRDLLGRYKGSIMGVFWTVINPIGHLLLYTFVFSVVLKVRFNGDASTSNFAMYLMAALLPWGALSESLTRATSAVTEQPNLVKKVVFPVEILPLAVAVSSMASQMIGLAVLVVVACILLGHVPASLIFLPLVMLSQFMFIGGLSWLLSSLGVYLQDLRHMMSLALSIWMYATPVVYPASAFPPKLQFLNWVNPMAGIVTDYRRILLEGLPPDWTMFAVYTTVAFACWSVGYFFFCKTKRSFADVV